MRERADEVLIQYSLQLENLHKTLTFSFSNFTGLTDLQESNSAPNITQVDKPKCRESNRISKVLQEIAREKTSKSYEALRVNISEVCQKRATEYSLNLLNEFLQDSYADLSNDTSELLLYVVELFHKEVLEFGNELVESRLSNFEKGAQSFSYVLVGELLNWYDDGFVQDVCELNTEFAEQMREFTEVAKQHLIPLCDNKIRRYGGLLGKAIEVRLQSAADLKAIKERNKDADKIAKALRETENGFSGKETGVSLHVADGLQISKERKNKSDIVAIELEEAENGILGLETGVRLQKADDPQASKERNTDSKVIDLHEAENGLMGKGTNTPDIQACREKADSDEASAELDNAENKTDDTNALELDILQPSMTEKKDKGKKYSFKRLWRGVKKIFCCCVSVVERD